MSRYNYQNIVQSVLEDFPEYISAYQELRGSFGDVGQHVVFGDFTRFFVALYQNTDESSVLLRKKIIVFIDQLLHTDDRDLHELVSVSFLENLWQANELYPKVKSELTEFLREELKHYETETPLSSE